MTRDNISSMFVVRMLLFGVFFGIVFTPVFAELETDKSIYLKDEPIKLSGTMDFQDGASVNIVEIEIINSDNAEIIVNEYIPISDDSFSRLYDPAGWSTGEYVVTVRYNAVEEIAEFEISDSPLTTDSDSADTDGLNDTSQHESAASSSLPNPPTNLNANVISSTQIDLSWSADDGDSITGYKIESRTNTDPNYSTVVANTGNSDTIYSHTNLISNTVYAYKVTAINIVGESEPSRSITVKTHSNDSDLALNASIEKADRPTGVVAKALSPTSVELTWNPPTQTYGQTIRDYTIKQEITSNIYSEIDKTFDASTSHTISNLNSGKTYTFVVLANYGLGSSDVSKDAIVTLPSSSVSDNDDQDNSNVGNPSVMSDDVPDSPINLDAKPVSSTQIDLSWSPPHYDDENDNKAAITGYKIEVRTTTGTSYSIVDNTKNADTAFSHTGLVPDTVYIYRVYGINDAGIGMPSNETVANTLSPESDDDNIQENNSTMQNDNNLDTTTTSVPSSPINLDAKPISQSRIDLSWIMPIDVGTSPIVGYKIESKMNNTSDYSTLVTNTGNPSTTYSHTGLEAGLTYQYRVSAINISGQSNPSDVAEATIALNSDDSINSQTLSQPVKIILQADKNLYAPADSINISGTIAGSTQNTPLGMRIIASNDSTVYVKSIVLDSNEFEVTIPQTQRQSSVWQNSGEFTIEVTYNGRIQATTTFQISSENTNVIIPENLSGNFENESDLISQPQLEEPVVNMSNNDLTILENQNIALQSDNQQLRDENNQLKSQVEDLSKRIENLDAVVKEQIRVIMDTLNAFKSDN